MNENPTQPNNPPPVDPSPVPQVVTKPRSLLIPLVVLLILVSVVTSVLLFVRYTAPTPLPSEVVAQPTAVPMFLAVDNLQQEVVVVDGEVLVSGKTVPNATVLIYSDTDETSLQSKADGSFESTILVNDSSGLVRVSAINEAGEEANVTFTVTDNTDVLGKSDSPPGLTKEDSEQMPRESESKSQKKVEDATTEPVTEDEDEISDDAEDNPPTEREQKLERVREFIEVKKTSEKVTKIGIRKYREIVTQESTKEASMQEERKEIKVQKMIARQASDAAVLKRSAVSGIVTGVNGSTLTVVHQIQRERVFTIHYNANTVITSQGDAESVIPVFTVGIRIAAVGEPIGADLLAKRIHIIPGKASGVLLRRPLATGSAEVEASPSATVSMPATPSATIEPSPEDTVTLSPSPTLGMQ